MSEEITVFTEVSSVSSKVCEVQHWIHIGKDESEVSNGEEKFSKAVFQASYRLVFVSIEDIADFPLNATNIKGMKTMSFNMKVKQRLRF